MQRSERFLSLNMLRVLDSKVFMILSSGCSVSSLFTQILKNICIINKNKRTKTLPKLKTVLSLSIPDKG